MIRYALAALAAFATVSAHAAPAQLSEVQIGDAARIKGNGLLQVWSISNEYSTANTQFMRLRRAEMKGTATFGDSARAVFMIDPAKLVLGKGQTAQPKTATMVQDIALTLVPLKGLELTAGQFKLPDTAEGLGATGELSLPERSLVGRSYGDRRELGVMARYAQQYFNTAAAVSTGQAIGLTGHRGLRDLHARAELTPTKSAGIGTFATLGSFEYQAKGRYGLNGRVRQGNADLRAEFGHGRTGAVHGEGAMTEAGWWFSENLETVARFDTFNPHSANPAVATRLGKAESIGVNYLLRDYNTRLQFSASALQNMAADNGTAVYKNGAVNRQLTLALQAAI